MLLSSPFNISAIYWSDKYCSFVASPQLRVSRKDARAQRTPTDGLSTQQVKTSFGLCVD